jgi:hypothetical protein
MQKHKRYQYHLKKQFDKTSLTVGNSFNNKMNMYERQQQISFYLSRLGEPCRTVFYFKQGTADDDKRNCSKAQPA